MTTRFYSVDPNSINQSTETWYLSADEARQADLAAKFLDHPSHVIMPENYDAAEQARKSSEQLAQVTQTTQKPRWIIPNVISYTPGGYVGPALAAGCVPDKVKPDSANSESDSNLNIDTNVDSDISSDSDCNADGDSYESTECGGNDCDDNDEEVGKGIPLYRDEDGDGYGDENADAIWSCSGEKDGYVDNNSDCNDDDASIYPGGPLSCGVYTVGCDDSEYSTIQAAVDDLYAGTISLCKSYEPFKESVTARGKKITFQSYDADSRVTWGGDGDRALTLQDGVYTLENIIFSENDSSGEDGAVHIGATAEATISDCLFKLNGDYTVEYGGAIYMEGFLILSGETEFESNSANYGGAIYVDGGEVVVPENATIRFYDNYANSGEAIYIAGGFLTVEDGDGHTNIWFMPEGEGATERDTPFIVLNSAIATIGSGRFSDDYDEDESDDISYTWLHLQNDSILYLNGATCDLGLYGSKDVYIEGPDRYYDYASCTNTECSNELEGCETP